MSTFWAMQYTIKHFVVQQTLQEMITFHLFKITVTSFLPACPHVLSDLPNTAVTVCAITSHLILKQHIQ